MKRISGDYIANTEGKCKICGRAIFPGMYVFNLELRGGKRAVAHSLCEKRSNLEKGVSPTLKPTKQKEVAMGIEVKEGKIVFKEEEKKSKNNGVPAIMLKIDGEHQEQLRQILANSGWKGSNERTGILQVADALLNEAINQQLEPQENKKTKKS